MFELALNSRAHQYKKDAESPYKGQPPRTILKQGSPSKRHNTNEYSPLVLDWYRLITMKIRKIR